MKKYSSWLRTLVTSKTATDTYILFSGRLLSAFLGFVFVVIIARYLSIEEFGIYSAAANLVAMAVAFTDLGLSTGVVNFVSKAWAVKDRKKEKEYLKAAVILRFSAVVVAAVFIFVFAKFVSDQFIASNNTTYAYWVAVLLLGFFAWDFFQHVLQAYKRFFASIVIDNSLGIMRLLTVGIFMVGGVITLQQTFLAYFVGILASLIVIYYYLPLDYFKARPDKKVYRNLIQYSGWIGVNRIISSLSGRLDIVMLASMSGAVAVGVYSVPQRLAMFVSILTASYTSVLAPRLSSLGDKQKEKAYIVKATLGLIPIIFGIFIWILVANPFITILFGERYSESVPVFQFFALSMIPFLFTAPSVGAIIYSMKRTKLIGLFSFVQVVLVFVLNYVFIPVYGPLGPTFTFMIVYTTLLFYTWYFVIKYYWFVK